jgi:aryl-alcohol dehydrogenase-like predicted oxidoreductase
LLSGKTGPYREFRGDDLRNTNPRFALDSRHNAADLLQQFQPLAEKYDPTITQLILAWTADVAGITHVLTGMRTPEQAKENAKSGFVDLDPDDFKSMDALYRNSGLQLPPAFVRKSRDDGS